MDKINNLLQHVFIIQKKYDEFAKITGENFNIFSVLKMDSKEVRMHSAFIGELLNPNGSHGLKELPLKIFIDLLQSKYNKTEINEGETKLIVDKFILNTESAITTVEKYIGFTNEDKTEGGRIDIIIEDKNKNAIIIENKIYAIEQRNQLIRYNNYSKHTPILYLTLDGSPPTSHGELKENIDYFNISYKEDIKDWLKLCLKEAVEFPMLREVIKQYLYLIKKLTNQTTNKKMEEEILENIVTNSKNIEGALVIAGIGPQKIKMEICKRLFDKIEIKIGRNILSENYNPENSFGQEESGMWYSEKRDFKIGVLLFFDADYKLSLGIDVYSGNSEEEKQRIRKLNQSNTGWVKTTSFDENFNNLKWESKLEDKNINDIVLKINQLIKEVDSLKTE